MGLFNDKTWKKFQEIEKITQQGEYQSSSENVKKRQMYARRKSKKTRVQEI